MMTAAEFARAVAAILSVRGAEELYTEHDVADGAVADGAA